MGKATGMTDRPTTMFIIESESNNVQFDCITVNRTTSVIPKEFTELCNKYNTGELKPTESINDFFNRINDTPERLGEGVKCHNHPEVYDKYIKRIKSRER